MHEIKHKSNSFIASSYPSHQRHHNSSNEMPIISSLSSVVEGSKGKNVSESRVVGVSLQETWRVIGISMALLGQP